MARKDILKLVEEDMWMMDVLQAAKTFRLPDWWIGGGFIRNKVWDVLHNYKTRTPLNDIDVVYFDKNNTDEQLEKHYEKRLKKLLDAPWSVKNQARMELVKNRGPYKSTVDGMSEWIETATCIGVKLNKNNKLELAAPHGISDLTNLILRPVKGQKDVFEQRLKDKNWLSQWPRLQMKM